MDEFMHPVRYKCNHNQLGGLSPSSRGFLCNHRIGLRENGLVAEIKPGNHKVLLSIIWRFRRDHLGF